VKIGISRKLALTVFIFILVIMVVENPFFTPLNLFTQSSQLTATNPNVSNGLSLQGSCLVNEDVKNVEATNSTSGQLVNAYQVNITIFNFMSLMLLFLPWVIYVYTELTVRDKNNTAKQLAKTQKRTQKKIKPAT